MYVPYRKDVLHTKKAYVHSTGSGKKGRSATTRVFWGEYEEFRSAQPRRLTSSGRCSLSGNSTRGQAEGNQCVTAPRSDPKLPLTQTRVIASLMIPDHVRLAHTRPMGRTSSSPFTYKWVCLPLTCRHDVVENNFIPRQHLENPFVSSNKSLNV